MARKNKPLSTTIIQSHLQRPVRLDLFSVLSKNYIMSISFYYHTLAR